MKRAVVYKDRQGDWVADDGCGSVTYCATWRYAMEAAYGHLAMGCER